MGQSSSCAGDNSPDAFGATLQGDAGDAGSTGAGIGATLRSRGSGRTAEAATGGPHSELAVGATLPGHDASARIAVDATMSAEDTDVETGPFERVVVGPVNVESAGHGPWTPESLSVIRPDQRYELAGEIERGGLGRIIKAYDKRLARQVVVKELLHNSTDSVKRFLREAKITAGLEHPSIVPVYDVGRWPDGVVFYSMKLVHGRSLEERIADTSSLADRIALVPKVTAVAEAIAYAHSHGVIHRDIKPRNILVGNFGETLVIDWGLAKNLDEQTPDAGTGGPFRSADPGLTSVGAVMGTPAFMAPEQARGEPVDPRADVYALGSILYYMLSGETPYEAGSSDTLLECLLAGPPMPAVEREANIPPDLLAIIDKAMERDPADRYPSAKEFAADLKRFQTGQLVGARQYSAVDLARRWLDRHRALVGLTCAALVLLAVAGAVSFHRIAQERDVAQQKTVEVERERGRAVSAQREAIGRGNRLVLLQAQSQLAEDPTAAVAWLKQYPADGEDWQSLVEIAEKANTAGFARSVWTAKQPITWADFSADGQRVAVASREVGIGIYNVDLGPVDTLPRLDTHAVAVRYVAGDRLALVGADRALYLWPGGDEPARVLVRFDANLTCMAASDDRRRLAVAAGPGDLRAFDVDTGREWKLAGHRDTVHAAAFSPDGEHLLSSGEDGQLRLWHLGSERSWVLHQGAPITWLGWAPDGRTVFVGRRSGAVEHRGLDGGLLATFEGHAHPVIAGDVSPDGKHVATGSIDKTARVWSLADGSSRIVNFAGPVTSVEYAPGGTALALSGIDRVARLVSSSGSVKELRGHDGPVWRATFARDGRTLVTASEDRSLRVWPVPPERGQAVGQHPGGITAVSASDDGWTVATGGRDGSIGVFDARGSGWQSPGTARATAVRGLAFLGSATRVAALHQDGEVLVWFRASHRWQSESLGRVDGATLLASASQGDRLAVVTKRGDVHYWDSKRGLRRVAQRGVETVNARYAPDGQRLAVSFVDGTVSIYGRDGTEKSRLEGHELRVRSLAWSPDGALLASAGYDGLVRLWRDGEIAATLQGHLGPVLTVIFSASGDQVISAGVDGVVRVWNASSGELLDEVPVGGALTTVASAPGGDQFAAAGYQGELRLFDRRKRRPFILSAADDGLTTWVGFAPDGRAMLATTGRGTLRRWELDESGGVPAGPPSEPDDIRQWLRAVSSAEIQGPDDPVPRSPTD